MANCRRECTSRRGLRNCCASVSASSVGSPLRFTVSQHNDVSRAVYRRVGSRGLGSGMGDAYGRRVTWGQTFTLLLSAQLCVACGLGRAQPDRDVQPYTPEAKYGSAVHTPERLGAIETGATNAMGEPVRVRCETCHALREDESAPRSAEQLTRFHQSLVLDHGNLTCLSCHAVGQPPKLKLADGTLLDTHDAIRLCAQCHGVQYDNYQHGAHGGMNGYWDLSRGPRVRNHCVDCHAPHAPAIKPVQPRPPPRDRFFNAGAGH